MGRSARTFDPSPKDLALSARLVTCPDMQADARPASRALDKVLHAYYPIRRFERSGRFYAAFGVRGLYGFVARLAGERPLDPPGAAFDPGTFPFTLFEVQRIETGGKYYEFANLMRSLLYVPTFVVGLQHGLPIVWLWSLVLIWAHLNMVGIERYKRILCEYYTPFLTEEYRPPAKPAAPKREGTRSLADRFFGPWGWESERLYQALGFGLFQRLVRFYANRTRLSVNERLSGQRFAFLEANTRQSMAQFLFQTRVSEVTHLLGAVLNLPLAIPLGMAGLWGWAAYGYAIVIFDMYCAGLQRYHRVRADRNHRKKRRRPAGTTEAAR